MTLDLTQRPATYRRGSSLARLGRLCLKELRETLRDRRTIITLVLMPLLVYPLLSIIFQRFLMTGELQRMAEQIVLGVRDDATREALEPLLLFGDQILAAEDPVGRRNLPNTGLKEFRWEHQPTVGFRVDPALDEHLADQAVDIGIILRGDDPQDEEQGIRFELLVPRGSLAADRALRFVRTRLDAVNEAYWKQRLSELGQSVAAPGSFALRSVGTYTEAENISLASVIPLVLILMTMTGAVYPAIDSTAGERERGTLEALIATPVPRFTLLLAKYIAVVIVSVLTASANLLAMSATLFSTGLADVLLGGFGVSLKTLLLTFFLLIVFAIFFSAVLLAVTSVARSFKEAQAYLIPLVLFCLGPSLICLAPGMHLNAGLSVTPLLNLVLLAKEIFEGAVPSGWWFVVLASSVMYAVAAVAVAARVFGSDAVLYGSEQTWSDLLRRPSQPTTHVRSHTTVFLLAVLLPVYILVATSLARWSGGRLAAALCLSTVATMFLFGGVPLAVAWHRRADFRNSFQWWRPAALSWLAAGILGVSLWPLLLWLAYSSGFTQSYTAKWDQAQSMIEQFQRLPLGVLVLALGLVPAVFEEWFFRGFVLSSFLTEAAPRKAILVSACLFGLFHVLSGTLAMERFLPSTAVGLVLGWVCWRSGSLFPGILLHALHNSILVTIAYFESDLVRRGWLDMSPLPTAIILALAVAGCVMGGWMMRQTTMPVHYPAMSAPARSIHREP